MFADPLALATLAAALVAAGVFAGLLAGLLGVGGGIVIVPVLFNLLSSVGVADAVTMHVAVGTSLATIIPTSIMSARAHHRKGAVDWALWRSWAPWVAVGVAIGTVIAASAKGPVLAGIFGTVALAVAFHMTFGKEHWRLSDHPPQGAIRAMVAAVIGAFSSMMGIGGGTLTVPTLVLCDYPIRRAVATSAAIGLIIAVPGALGFIITGWDMPGRPDLSLGYVSVLGLCLISPLSMAMAPVGAKLAHTVQPLLLKRAFAVFLALTAARMLYKALS